MNCQTIDRAASLPLPKFSDAKLLEAFSFNGVTLSADIAFFYTPANAPVPGHRAKLLIREFQGVDQWAFVWWNIKTKEVVKMAIATDDALISCETFEDGDRPLTKTVFSRLRGREFLDLWPWQRP